MLLAGVLKAPSLVLTEGEAKQLAQATADVSRHYNVQATQKTLDWINLLTAGVLIYGTRIMAASKRKREEAQGDGTVVHYPFPGQPLKEPMQ